VAESYARTRYGHKDLTAEERARLDSNWGRLRNRLFKRVLRLK
jgi:hypothetical protein